MNNYKKKYNSNDHNKEYDENYLKNNILKISIMKEDYDNYIDNAKKYAKWLKENGLSTSQIRKVYSDIKYTQTSIELKRLRPKLAYIIGRNSSNRGIRSFLNILDCGLKKLNIEEDINEINSIKEFAETIVAYLKYYGDKE
ncbi:type III-A CRISPR-associated protein Csm2 [uncultured Clostridium sp.]|uniref:type III-A CRISPR-associated protein Csm2 n=1 Tax=uncultured Clostridium sp. TaxID=59620 RepID=UPI0025FE6930|nr:type III-A CRISPR-associated protein Csm2 [uncultured Clostridium sp.]